MNIPVPCHDIATSAPIRSRGDFPTRDPVAWRREYTDRWAEFIRGNFANPRQVAAAFAVDHRTARDWWHGRGASQGWAAAYAAAHFPEARRQLLRSVE